MTWKEFFEQKKLRLEFFVTIVFIIGILTALANFLLYTENRDGVVLNDPVLKLINPIDLTWITFGLIYFSLFAALLSFLKKPELLLFALQAYIVMTVFRIVAMYLVPLDPPAKMISLSDPFVEFLGTGRLLTKDLFFSGHTATIFLFFLLTNSKYLKAFFLLCTILVAACVLVQHVHYSIDVFAAPFFAYCSFIIAKKFRRRQ